MDQRKLLVVLNDPLPVFWKESESDDYIIVFWRKKVMIYNREIDMNKPVIPVIPEDENSTCPSPAESPLPAPTGLWPASPGRRGLYTSPAIRSNERQ